MCIAVYQSLYYWVLLYIIVYTIIIFCKSDNIFCTGKIHDRAAFKSKIYLMSICDFFYYDSVVWAPN